jgi:hypothetical protein
MFSTSLSQCIPAIHFKVQQEQEGRKKSVIMFLLISCCPASYCMGKNYTFIIKTMYKQCLMLTMRDFLMNIAMSLLVLSFYFYGYSYSYSQTQAQPLTAGMITYSKQSSFIKEFNIPNNIQELGLKGITTDSNGNAWFYHTTNKTTKIIKFEPGNENFTQYDVGGNTVVDNAIINLAGGQLIFDNDRSSIWFTDARTNSIGKLDTRDGKIELVSIPRW